MSDIRQDDPPAGGSLDQNDGRDYGVDPKDDRAKAREPVVTDPVARAAVVTGPRPGDADYSAPARVAQPAGMVLRPEHYDYNPGAQSRRTVDLAMPAPAYETVTSDTLRNSPSQMTQVAATSAFRKITGDFRNWIQDFPHPVTGELAVVAQFFRDLNARRQSRNMAVTLGREVPEDGVDKAKFVPPPEYFQLRQMAASAMHIVSIYEQALLDAGATLVPAARDTIDKIKADFEALASGPQDAEDVEGIEETPALDASSAALHSPTPIMPADQLRAKRSMDNRIADPHPQTKSVGIVQREDTDVDGTDNGEREIRSTDSIDDHVGEVRSASANTGGISNNGTVDIPNTNTMASTGSVDLGESYRRDMASTGSVDLGESYRGDRADFDANRPKAERIAAGDYDRAEDDRAGAAPGEHQDAGMTSQSQKDASRKLSPEQASELDQRRDLGTMATIGDAATAGTGAGSDPETDADREARRQRREGNIPGTGA
jgi:hypothetical protein